MRFPAIPRCAARWKPALVLLVVSFTTGLGGGCSEPTPTRVFIRSDAPTTSPRLFHRIYIEVRRQDVVCEACEREFSYDTKTFPNGVGSFEILGDGSADVRVRLVRELGGAFPRTAATIEASASVSLDGRSYTIDVPMAQVARPLPQAVAAAGTHDQTPAPLAPSLPPFAATCTGAPREGEVCVPGGRYWMGDSRLDLGSGGDDVDGTLERLVTVDAFYMDATEVTVGAFRKSGLASSSDLVPAGSNACTYPSDPSNTSADRLPVNCVTHRLAQTYCRSVGATLPTEAEFEYVAGGLRSSSYIWGDDAPRCGDAIVYLRTCPQDRPQPVATTGRDAFEVRPKQPIFDIVGNVHEYTADYWNPQTGPCWGTGHFKNPLCTIPDVGRPRARSLRGGAYADLALFSAAALREYVDNADARVGSSAGFRCVRR